MSNAKAYRASEFKTRVKKNIKVKLKELGWTEAKFAAESGVSRGMITRWLDGDATPTIASLAKICNSLGEPPEFFLGRKAVAGE